MGYVVYDNFYEITAMAMAHFIDKLIILMTVDKTFR